MNGIIIYKSKYGTTKKYAEWLSEETGFECIDASKVKIADLNDYDTIVFGGSVYASKILIGDFAEKCMKTIFDKKVIMFCVGSLMQSSENTKKLKETLNKEEFQNVPLFYCRGAINVNKMGFFDRFLCKTLIKLASKKDAKFRDDIESLLVEAGFNNNDWSDKKYLNPIIREIKGENV